VITWMKFNPSSTGDLHRRNPLPSLKGLSPGGKKTDED